MIMDEKILYILILLTTNILLLFMPKYGFLAVRKRYIEYHERKKVENALKHLYDSEYKHLTCSINSIAGVLHLNPDKAAMLIDKLKQQDLVRYSGDMICLTKKGKEYAVQVIRTHRLWETYLAEETGVDEKLWHKEAERMEHKLTKEQTEELAAKLGKPLFDPHGDPIPDYYGDVPADTSVKLENVKDGELVVVTHIEDEPDIIYKKLLQKGIKAGSVFRLLERHENDMWVNIGQKQIKLDSTECANLSVKPATDDMKPENFITLDKLKMGDIARIRGISQRCKGQQRRRLMDLGVIPGTEIKAEYNSAAGDPVAYSVKGATIALRRSIAKEIYIENGNGQK
jgi:DtxR family Mn-dependent transcriptional regulator